MLAIKLTDSPSNPRVLLLSIRTGLVLPTIKSARGNMKRAAHLLHRKGGAVLLNKRVSHFDVRLKMAVAFFNLSLSLSLSPSRYLSISFQVLESAFDLE